MNTAWEVQTFHTLVPLTGRCSQAAIRLSSGSPMEEMKKGLKGLREFAASKESNSVNWTDLQDLPGTGPPTKEYTWRDPWLWPHMWQRMTFLASVGGEALGPECV